MLCVCVQCCVQALAEGREWQLLETRLLTPQGFKLLQCCRMALEQLQKALAVGPEPACAKSSSSSSSNETQGKAAAATCSRASQGSALEAAARELVGLMCEGRLVPTPWLNEVGDAVVPYK